MLGKNLPHESRVFPSKVIHPLMLLEKICHQTCPQWRSPGLAGQVGTSSKNTQFFKETLCHDRQWWEICSNSKKKYFIDFSAENYNFEERSWHFQCWASIWIERRKIQIGAIPPPTPPSTLIRESILTICNTRWYLLTNTQDCGCKTNKTRQGQTSLEILSRWVQWTYFLEPSRGPNTVKVKKHYCCTWNKEKNIFVVIAKKTNLLSDLCGIYV